MKTIEMKTFRLFLFFFVALDVSYAQCLNPEVDYRCLNLENNCSCSEVQSLDLTWWTQVQLPTTIGYFTSLISFAAGFNSMESIPTEIGNLKKLNSLFLGGNRITSFPTEFGNLKNLNSLSLELNWFETIPSAVFELTNLTTVHLHENRLSTIPTEIGQLTSLTVISLDSNQIAALPTEIGNLRSLKRFSVYDNKLVSLPTEISQLTALEYFGWESNNFECRYYPNSTNVQVQMFVDYINRICACNCSLNGSVSLECELSGQCNCSSRFSGEKCNECATGYYGSNCELCPPCGNGTCFDGRNGNGTCFCHFGFTYNQSGSCNECISGYYFKNGSCLSCECDLNGSIDVDCDSNGQCHCRIGYDGQHCESLLNIVNECYCGQGSINGSCLVNGDCFCENGFSLPKCEECVDNFYGDSCALCDDCGKGFCLDGISGDGKCNCDMGWTIRPFSNGKCDSCLTGVYGLNCSETCPDCGRGICLQGPLGNGTCECEYGWSHSVSNFCSQCIKGFSLVNGECIRCSPGCANCTGSSEIDCLTCLGNLDYNTTIENVCSSTCPPGKFMNNAKDCLDCHLSCLSCYGPNDNECVTCQASEIYEDGYCVSECRAGNSYIQDNYCVGCNIFCNGCTNSSTCLSCKDIYVLDDGKCVEKCSQNNTFINEKKECKLCHSSCKSCSGSLENQCTECFSESSLFQGECKNSCPQGYYSDSFRNCLKCNDICKECFGSGFLKCISCYPDGPLRYIEGSTCVSRCSEFKYPSDNICQPCECYGHSNYCNDLGRCLECANFTTGNNCEKCLDGYDRTPLSFNSSCSPLDCECNNRSSYCDSKGACINCENNTEGKNCENCKEGYEWNENLTECILKSEKTTQLISSLTIGLIIGGIILFCMILVMVFVCMLLKKKKFNFQKYWVFMPSLSNTEMEILPSYSGTSLRNKSSYKTNETTMINTKTGKEITLPGYLKINSEDIRIDNEIATGGGGKIFHGSILNSEIRNRFPGFCDNTAIKLVHDRKDSSAEENLENFWQEVSVNSSMSFHQNIAKLIAYCENPNYIMSPLYEGDLSDLIYNSDMSYSSSEVMDIMENIVSGMKAIHSMGIAHRDVKPKNMLLEKRNLKRDSKNKFEKSPGEWTTFPYRIKICDFGVCYVESQALVTNQRMTNLFGLSTRYASPEVFSLLLNDSHADLKDFQMSDVYSFSISIWETIHRLLPWHGKENEIKDRVLNGERPELKIETNTYGLFISQTIISSWNHDPTLRPNFQEIHRNIIRFVGESA